MPAQLYIFVSRKWPLPPWSSAFASCAPRDWHLPVRVPVYRARSAHCVSAFLLPQTLPSFSSPGTSDFPPSSTRCPSELLPVSVPIVLGSPSSAVPPVVYRWWLVSRSAPQSIGKPAPPRPACLNLARIHPALSCCRPPDPQSCTWSSAPTALPSDRYPPCRLSRSLAG